MKVRNAVGVVAEVSDQEATRLQRYGWTSVDKAEATTADDETDKKAAPRKRAAKKSDK